MSEATLTNAEIQQLIACRKVVVSKPREPQRVNKNFQQRFVVRSEETGKEFLVFIAWSQMQPQDFSIGLMWGNYLLLRVNGFHGTTRSGYHQAKHHAAVHTHTLTVEDIQNDRCSKPSKITDASGKYVDLASARLYFFEICGIMGYEECFSSVKQISIDDL